MNSVYFLIWLTLVLVGGIFFGLLLSIIGWWMLFISIPYSIWISTFLSKALN